MKIAIIGAGQVGQALGSNWRRSGLDITFGVRKPQESKTQSFVQSIGASAKTLREASQNADIVVLCLPWAAAESAIPSLGNLSGKTVIDCMNPLMKAGQIELDRGYDTSGAETVAGWLPEANVVKTLNQTGAEIMADSSQLSGTPVMFLAGDEEEAKEDVSKLVALLGFEPLDAGPLKRARLLEPLALVWINQAIAQRQGRSWALGVLRNRER